MRGPKWGDHGIRSIDLRGPKWSDHSIGSTESEGPEGIDCSVRPVDSGGSPGGVGRALSQSIRESPSGVRIPLGRQRSGKLRGGTAASGRTTVQMGLKGRQQSDSSIQSMYSWPLKWGSEWGSPDIDLTVLMAPDCGGDGVRMADL
jgi:hypothetical protein